MIPLERFLQLPAGEVAALVRATGSKVCVFPVNGTRRWFMLEHADSINGDFFEAYMNASIQNHIELCSMLFDHGIDTILSPVFGRELMRRGDEYTKHVGIDGLVRTATDMRYRAFFEQYDIKVRFYGDFRDVLTATPYEHALQSIHEVTEATKNHATYKLLFGVFADESTETIARLSVQHYLAEGVIPDSSTLVRKYYGDDLPPISLFIGFDKFAVFDMPLLATGGEDLYFSLSPSPYMTVHQLRSILYDHIFVRRTPEPDYTKLPVEELDQMRRYYRANRDRAFGVGTLRHNLWFPETEAARVTDSISQLIDEIGPGYMPATAYDTAWAARLGEIDPVLSNRALSWLTKHQLPDGSWGAPAPMYYHDRVACTLAAMIALAYRGHREHDREQIERGQMALERIVSGMTGGLQADPNGATVGFEMIAPTLAAEAEKLGLIKNQGNRILGRMSKMRAKKLSFLESNMISRYVTMAFSAEMAGTDGRHMLDIDNLQEDNGSVGVSPSATAYFATYIRKGDPASLNYLRSVMRDDGGFPNVAPFDVFEIAWALWNLSFIPDLKKNGKLKPHLDFLSRAWKPRVGIGFAAGFSVRDSDDSGLVYDTLLRFGIEKDLASVLLYEEKDYFRCFDLEANPSISANIHVLGALGQAGLDRKNASVQKVLKFLSKARGSNPFWIDKWHSSAYYATAHAVIACAAIANDLVAESAEWIIRSQNADGSWGTYLSTAEETAYALQALWLWNEKVARVPKNTFKKGAHWLAENMDKPYPPLWIGKCLYSPHLVIRSAVISALALTG